MTLNSVIYDSSAAKCRSNVRGDGAAIEVGSLMDPIRAQGPFSISCERTPVDSPEGTQRYPRFELLVDTNQGAYTLAMSDEDVLGYDLASSNKASIASLRDEASLSRSRLDECQRDIARVNASYSNLQQSTDERISGVTANAHTAVQGQFGADVGCSQDGGDINALTQSICGSSRVAGLRVIATRSGHKCGYTTYLWACISVPN